MGIIRFTTAGAVNFSDSRSFSSFGGMYATGVTVDVGGKIVVVGTLTSPVAGITIPVVRYSSDGVFDSAYSNVYTGGTQMQEYPYKFGWHVTVDGINNYYIIGTAVAGSAAQMQMELVKLRSTRFTWDTTFGTKGAVHVPFTGFSRASGIAVSVSGDNMPVIAGAAMF